MYICVVFVLLLSSGAVIGASKKLLKQAQFIADIYQQFPHSCILIINPEAQQQGEEKVCIFYISRMLLVEKTVLIPVKKRSACGL